MNLLFLDVDGVLNDNKTINRTPYGFIGIDDEKVKLLADICKQFNYSIVLSSDWKDNLCIMDNDGIYLAEKLLAHKLVISGITPFIKNGVQRGVEIAQYLESYGNIVDKYVILDDELFDFDRVTGIANHVVRTNFVKNAKPSGIFSVESLSLLDNTISKEVTELLEFINNYNIEENKQ